MQKKMLRVSYFVKKEDADDDDHERNAEEQQRANLLAVDEAFGYDSGDRSKKSSQA